MNVAKITITVGDWARHYSAFVTSAPKAYDRGLTIEIVGEEGSMFSVSGSRVVLIERREIENQVGRYGSGLEMTMPVEWEWSREIERMIIERIYQK